MTTLKESLRQMLAALQQERQALAAIDLEAIFLCSSKKSALVDDIAARNFDQIDDECRGMVEAAHRLNEVNRHTRNLLAANVASRLNSLTGRSELYCIDSFPARIGHRPA
jgi:hypothetical protein